MPLKYGLITNQKKNNLQIIIFRQAVLAVKADLADMAAHS